ncbi:MAG: multicopper oxidase domain-containing protein [Bryobacteraceae bacterium]|jgi:manganese oxidase
MDANRRDFFARLTALGATFAASVKSMAAQSRRTNQPATGQAAMSGMDHSQHAQTVSPAAAGSNAAAKAAPPNSPQGAIEPFLPVQTPDLGRLPFKMVDGVKEFNLVAEVVQTHLVPERPMTAWGYNGSVPGPTIEVQEGDRVRIIFDNHLPEPTTPHWHGLEIPIEMDGVPGVTQDPVMPGGRFVYEFTLNQNGTFFYHSHMPMQEMMGMIGLFIIHPKQAHQPKVDRDFAFVLQEWGLLPNNNVPNTLAMEFNWLTMNGKTGPATTPLLVKQGERVRIRLVNLGMDHHPIHLHGVQFVVTGTEAGRQPESTWGPGNTVLVGVAQARDVEFVAKYTGDWMLHCHMPHHNMNQMVSMVGPMMMMGQGMTTGGSMTSGMGIVTGAHALSDDLGPSLGRGLGLAADSERRTSNVVTAQAHVHEAAGPEDVLTTMYPKDDPEKKKIAGYPQDMWMVMDETYKNKPETFGLRPGWTGGMMGMMTLVRVLPPDKFDAIMARMPVEARQAEAQNQPAQPKKPVGMAFTGQVQAVSESTGRLTVNHGTVPGWMNAMTMAYPVDKPEALKAIKAGDRISATVFEGDLTLHDVKVVPGGNK